MWSLKAIHFFLFAQDKFFAQCFYLIKSTYSDTSAVKYANAIWRSNDFYLKMDEKWKTTLTRLLRGMLAFIQESTRYSRHIEPLRMREGDNKTKVESDDIRLCIDNQSPEYNVDFGFQKNKENELANFEADQSKFIQMSVYFSQHILKMRTKKHFWKHTECFDFSPSSQLYPGTSIHRFIL